MIIRHVPHELRPSKTISEYLAEPPSGERLKMLLHMPPPGLKDAEWDAYYEFMMQVSPDIPVSRAVTPVTVDVRSQALQSTGPW